jgi:thiol-disulfide isomerase/thioredoxin
MKKILLFVLLANLSLFAFAQQQVKVIKHEDLQKQIAESKGLTIFNFWATWCRPCVAELPHFAEVAKKYKKDVTIVLVSLDFAKNAQTRVQPFLQKRNWGMQCVLLNETDADKWIPSVAQQWDGAIPASLVVHHEKGVREFYDGELSKEELEGIVQEFR